MHQKMNIVIIYSKLFQSFEAFILDFSSTIHDIELITGLTFFTTLDPAERIKLITEVNDHIWVGPDVNQQVFN